MFEGKAAIQADFQPATTCQLAGEVVDVDVRIWLLDAASGQAVSDVAQGPYPKTPPVIGLPIII